MNDACSRVRTVLPDHIARDRDVDAGVEAHLEVCSDCRAERRLLALLYEGRATAPEGLAERVEAALAGVGGPGPKRAEVDPRRSRGGAAVPGFPWWGLAAAAVSAVALGWGIYPPSPSPADDLPAFVDESEAGALWFTDDGEVAGVPAWESLTDAELEILLDELENGGAA